MRFTYAEAMTQATYYAPLAQAAEAAGYTSMTVADSLIYPKESDSTYPYTDTGDREFLLGKYVLTAAGLPFLIVYKHHPLFGTRFRAGWLLHVFVSLYLVLMCYQWMLLHAGRPGPPAASPDSTIARLLQAESW